MNNFRRQILMFSYKLSDVMIMIISFIVASRLRFFRIDVMPISQFFQMRLKVMNFLLFLVFLLLWHLIFLSMGHYRSRRFSKFSREIKDIVKATSGGTLSIYMISLLFKVGMVNWVFAAAFWVSSTLITICSRFLLRYTLKFIRRRGRNLRYLLIVGTNRRTLEFVKKIEAEQEFGYVISGFVDMHWEGMQEFEKAGYSLVCDFNGFNEFINNNVVDEVIISLPIRSYYHETAKIVNVCENHGIVVRHLSNIFDSRNSSFKLESSEDDSFVPQHSKPMENWEVLIKKLLDIALAAVLLVGSSPIFLVAAILIKTTSRGPVFFIQERIGLNKRRFRLYKFRTMTVDAEKRQAEFEGFNEVDGAAFKIKNDPRITEIGKFLRRSSIDELPQFINVIIGDMSLVGPRPLPVRDYNCFNTDWHRRRFSVRPGITCLWQVNGRHNIHFARWMELDLEYIDHWSLLLDLRILMKTIPAVLRGFGAS